MAGRIKWRRASSALLAVEAAARASRSVALALPRWAPPQRSLHRSSNNAASSASGSLSLKWSSTLFATVTGKDSHPIEQWLNVHHESQAALEQLQARASAVDEAHFLEAPQGTYSTAPPGVMERHSADVAAETDAHPAEISSAKSPRRSGLGRLPYWISRLGKGQVLEPMTGFLEVAAESLTGVMSVEARSLTASVMNNVVQALAETASTPRFLGRGVVQTFRWSNVAWVPFDETLFPDFKNDVGDFKALPPATLAFVALTHVYDIAATLRLELSAAALASLLRALPYHVSVRVYDECLALILLKQNGVETRQAQLQSQKGWEELDRKDYARASIHIIAAAIHGHGILDQRKKGETLLGRWSLVQAPSEHPNISLPPVNGLAGATFPSGAWRDHVGIWSALIESRARNNDLLAARHWLLQYRQHMRNDGLISQPYFQYLRYCTSRLKTQRRPSRVDAKPDRQNVRRALMLEVLQMLAKDGIAMNEQLLTLVVNAEVGFGNLGEAARAIRTTVNGGHLEANKVPPSFFKAIFRLHARHFLRDPQASGGPFDELGTDLACPPWCPFPDFRQLFCAFASRLRFLQNPDDAKSARETCVQALEASLTMGDLPLALVVMQHMAWAGVWMDKNTHLVLFRWLSRNEQGFGARRRLRFGTRGQSLAIPFHLVPTDPRDRGAATVTVDGPSTKAESSDIGPILPGLSIDMPTSLRIVDYHVQLAVITLVRKALQEGADGFAPWVRAICSRLQRKGLDDSTTTKSDIVMACLEDVLCEPTSKPGYRPLRIKHLKSTLSRASEGDVS